MPRNKKEASSKGLVNVWLILVNAIILEQGWISDSQYYKLFYLTLPCLIASLVSSVYMSRKKNRNIAEPSTLDGQDKSVLTKLSLL